MLIYARHQFTLRIILHNNTLELTKENCPNTTLCTFIKCENLTDRESASATVDE